MWDLGSYIIPSQSIYPMYVLIIFIIWYMRVYCACDMLSSVSAFKLNVTMLSDMIKLLAFPYHPLLFLQSDW